MKKIRLIKSLQGSKNQNNKSSVKKLKLELSVLALCALATLASPVPAKAAAGKVTVDIEKLTIGQGLYAEPTQVSIDDGDTVKDVIDEYMKSISGTYKYSTSDGWYLVGISGADTAKTAAIPDEIANISETYDVAYLYNGYLLRTHSYSTPTTNNNLGNSDTELNEGDYGIMSGFVVTVNNKAVMSNDSSISRTDGHDSTNPTVRNIFTSQDQIKVSDGDVIRIMFTVYGYGADVGIDTYYQTGITAVSLADKTELLAALSDVKSSSSYWMVYANVASAYNEALSVAGTYNPTQSTVNSAITRLKNALASPQNPTVGQAQIKSAKNVKGQKIKITMKNMFGITGYQYKYGNNKKLKNKKKKKYVAITKRTTKAKFTTKKIKVTKKKKGYVKVRAYVKVNGSYIYGEWTKVKKVKMRK